MREWTAFYPDGIILRSEDHSWLDIPEGIVITVERLLGRRNLWKGDWVYIDEGEFGRVPPTSLGEPWAEKPNISCVSCVKKGVLVSDEEYQSIHDLAWQEPWL